MMCYIVVSDLILMMAVDRDLIIDSSIPEYIARVGGGDDNSSVFFI